jgi:activator of HSP90 ATPase
MSGEFTVSATLPATPQQLYDAWLSSKGHAAMTGSPARVSSRPGGKFSAWDGYISGKNLKLDPGRRIVQAWRTTEFALADPDSQIDIQFAKAPGGAKLTLHHTNIPANQSDYRSGWRECYFEPMTAYFNAAPSAATSESENRAKRSEIRVRRSEKRRTSIQPADNKRSL